MFIGYTTTENDRIYDSRKDAISASLRSWHRCRIQQRAQIVIGVLDDAGNDRPILRITSDMVTGDAKFHELEPMPTKRSELEPIDGSVE